MTNYRSWTRNSTFEYGNPTVGSRIPVFRAKSLAARLGTLMTKLGSIEVKPKAMYPCPMLWHLSLNLQKQLLGLRNSSPGPGTQAWAYKGRLRIFGA